MLSNGQENPLRGFDPAIQHFEIHALVGSMQIVFGEKKSYHNRIQSENTLEVGNNGDAPTLS